MTLRKAMRLLQERTDRYLGPDGGSNVNNDFAPHYSGHWLHDASAVPHYERQDLSRAVQQAYARCEGDRKH